MGPFLENSPFMSAMSDRALAFRRRGLRSHREEEAGSKKQKGTELGEEEGRKKEEELGEEEAERRQRRHKGGKMKRGWEGKKEGAGSRMETEKARKDAREQRREIEWGGVVGGG